MKTMPLTERSDQLNLQFKMLSAIGIIIIVSGHCYHGGISLAYEWFPTYSFQLSLFVFISGYFYKPRYEDNLCRYLLKRLKRLVIPAYLWNIAYGLFILLMKNLGYSIGGDVTMYNLFVMPFVDGETFLYNLGSWFVYPLFLVSGFNILFRRLLRLLKIRNEYFFLVLYFAVGMYGIHLAITDPANGIMKLLTRAMFFLPSYQLGYIYRARWEKRDTLSSVLYFAVLFAVQLMLITFSQDLQYFPSGMASFQNGVIIPYVTSVTGIAFWLRISKLLTPIVGDWRFVRLIADNTYSIMIHQMLGFMTVKWGFYLLSVTTGLFTDFNAEFMRSSIWYYYLPKGLEQYGMVYLAGGIFVPIAIKKLCDMYGYIGQTAKNKVRQKFMHC